MLSLIIDKDAGIEKEIKIVILMLWVVLIAILCALWGIFIRLGQPQVVEKLDESDDE